MKYLSQLAALSVTVTLLAACSSGSNGILPQTATTSAPTAPHDKGNRHTMCKSDETICVIEPPDNNIGFNNCIIGCYGATPTGGGYVGPWGAGGGGGCISNPDNCLAYPNGPAQYGDQCSKDSEMIGHDVPGLPPSQSIEITNEYPVTLGTTLLGYVYTTWGSGNGANGIAYFVPISAAVGIGIISIGADTAIAVGTNGWVQGSTGGTVLNALTQIVTLGKAPSMKNACFTSNWNGSHPSGTSA